MKKFLLSCVLMFGFASGASAQEFQPAGGFQGPGLPVSTVAEAMKMSDDSAVVLEGKIEKALGKDKYLFHDQTGSVTVEIDADDWRGVVKPEDTVVIRGEVEKELFNTEIDADSVEIKK